MTFVITGIVSTLHARFRWDAFQADNSLPKKAKNGRNTFPPKNKKDSQSCLFEERRTGLEPATTCLEGKNSTIELPPLVSAVIITTKPDYKVIFPIGQACRMELGQAFHHKTPVCREWERIRIDPVHSDSHHEGRVPYIIPHGWKEFIAERS